MKHFLYPSVASSSPWAPLWEYYSALKGEVGGRGVVFQLRRLLANSSKEWFILKGTLNSSLSYTENKLNIDLREEMPEKIGMVARGRGLTKEEEIDEPWKSGTMGR